MGKTLKHVLSAKYKIHEREWRIDKRVPKPWTLFTESERKIMFPNYSKSPSWWRRLYMRRPNRHTDKVKLKRLIGKPIKEAGMDDEFYSHPKKPHYYFY